MNCYRTNPIAPSPFSSCLPAFPSFPPVVAAGVSCLLAAVVGGCVVEADDVCVKVDIVAARPAIVVFSGDSYEEEGIPVGFHLLISSGQFWFQGRRLKRCGSADAENLEGLEFLRPYHYRKKWEQYLVRLIRPLLE
jgi:hypothetical protein